MAASVDGIMNIALSTVPTALLVRLGEVVNRTFVLPVLVFCPTSRCNSRCRSCDWWMHSGADDLTLEEIESVADALPELGTRIVAFSGGEPLVRADVFEAARMFRARGMSLQLLTSGVLLERFADRVAEHFSHVYISLDAATDALYADVRGIDGLAAVGRGVARVRRAAPALPVHARATLHRANFRELPRLIDHARAIGVDGISFLAADLTSTAFGRMPSNGPAETSVPAPRDHALVLDRDEVAEFERIVERAIATYADAFESGYVAETPEKLRRLPRYYAALAGDGRFPPVRCNVPWVSVVLEASGAVRPCFFHPAVGNVRRAPLATIVERNLRAFRATLDVAADPTCTRCVCSFRTGFRGGPWQ